MDDQDDVHPSFYDDIASILASENISASPEPSFTYSIVDNESKPPYFCSCEPSQTFNCRQNFRRHMEKHGIMIPNKSMNKRKVDAIVEPTIDLTKDFKRYDWYISYLYVI